MAGSSIQYGYRPMGQDPEPPPYPPPPIYSSASANYARLCVLVIDVGTIATKQKVLDNLPESQTLTQALEVNIGKMEGLKAMKVMNEAQFDLLYPPSSAPVETHKIDLTLWVILLRHITADAKKINKKWQEKPQYWHKQYWHDIQRLKKIRNQLAHPGNKAELDEETFQQMWRESEHILLRLGVQESIIKSYQEGNIDPERARVSVQEVTNQYVSDFNALLKRTKIGSRRQNVLFSLIGGAIILLILAAIVTVILVVKPWRSCADNIQYVSTDYAMVGYLTRKGWGGRKPKAMDRLTLPVKYVVISHTAQVTTPCTTIDDCCATVRKIQKWNMEKDHWSDIAYNYVIGGSGTVFIGRGPHCVGAAALGWNARVVSIGFIGLFTLDPPPPASFNALKTYLTYLVETEVITSNFTLYGLCQVRKKFPDAPGAAFLRKLEQMFPDNWKADNITDCNMNGTYIS